MSGKQANPIVEAILDIECDLPPYIEIKKLRDDSERKFGDRYPKTEIRHTFEYTIQSKPDSDPKGESRQEVDGYLFRNEEGNQLVQVRGGGFSFNRLKPYGSLDDYLPEIERTWILYSEVTQPLQVREIRLRYINRVDIDSGDSDDKLEQYFFNIPKMPTSRLSSKGFLSQYHALEKATGNEVQTTITALSRTASTIPIIVDITTISRKATEVGDWQEMLAIIESLRELKNSVYQGTLTELCLQQFQPT